MRLACAQRHLEAWFFGDEAGVRAFLQRNLGAIDLSNPDAMVNPKQQLANLLDEMYSARVAEAVARAVDPARIAERSASFRAFVEAAKNGASSS